MSKHGAAAEIAVSLIAQDNSLAPGDAWKRAVAQVFPGSRSSREKPCPRDSFLTLCETGAVRHVAPGTYTRSVKNRRYVTLALDALRSDPALAGDQKGLWEVATEGAGTRPNGQIDVLLALWRRGLVRS